MTERSDLLSRAYALLDAEPEFLRTVEEMHLHFVGEPLASQPREAVPGLVLRWLHCACDLELWQGELSERPPHADLERTLDFVAKLEELGIEPVGETRCIDCGYRKRCG